MLITSKRKTGFIGLIVCLKSAENLFDDLLKTGELNFILTYKISQNHLEMFFSAIRAKGGFNNNPTTMQFWAAYEKLLIHTELKTSEEANSTALDNTTILSVSSLAKRSEENYLDLLCANESDEDMIEDDLTEYSIDVLEYISGFIVKKVLSKIKCSICSDAIQDSNRISINLLDIKKQRWT